MKIMVSSVVIFEIPDGSDLDVVAAHFRESHRVAIGTPMKTLTGQRYILTDIERLEVKAR